MGGTWTTQNKRRPGAYINVKGAPQPKPDTSIGRTLLLNHVQLDWGAKGVIELDTNSDFKALLGSPLTDARFGALRETLKGALTVLLLNNNDGKKATVTDEGLPWTFTAKYPGVKGNSLHVSVEKDPNDETRITVSTIYGTEIVDQQVVRTTTASSLKSNEYINVTFTDDGKEVVGQVEPTEGGADFTAAPGKPELEALAVSTTYNLAGGTTETVPVTDLLNDALETEQFNVATSAGFEPKDNIHQLLATAIQRLREDEGYKVRAVVPNYEGGATYDYEGVSVVANGVVLADGTKVDTTSATGYFAGASSAADAHTSLTYSGYPGATSVYPKLNNEQTIRGLNEGWIIFTAKRGDRVVIEQDINSLTSFTEDKPKQFGKNRIIRTLDTIVTNTEEAFENTFLGRVNNDPTGRDLFKANRVAYLQNLSEIGVIADFDPADLTVDPGDDKDAILVTLAVTPIDSMEKLYMTIIVH
ncbi:Phage related protein [Agrilactobacillus composti DSM 18527 = JCM 14202]|uniref:Phage related protein n=1 Tax=Agrilactobacillus composti DSM 18527 = JCM 14202 TaxID=1423734 RepID=X0PUP6_9LACO|nr:phage tail sheath family protein [Agrilactobacillus composti]KRM35609.1 Phage related protein [Agrilactobacillus composti DSM 18527 = JCM 14202]GAF41126.1 phage-like element PBSX protein XkdK [Agrilactobacillus composti DSM 18527 = JCM 14202]